MSVSNGEPLFDVTMAKKVTDELKILIAKTPRASDVIASLKRISERLERDPWDFGEQRYHLYDARLQVRVAVVAPVAVEYGVHMDLPKVYIRTFVALEGA